MVGNPLVGATDMIALPDDTFYATIWNTLYTGLRQVDASADVLRQTAFVFQTPRGLSQAPNGDLYIVAAAPVHRATVMNGTTFEKITEWGSFGTADDQFSAPYDVAVAPNGNVYVADSGNDVVKVFGTPVATPTTSWGRLKGGFGG